MTDSTPEFSRIITPARLSPNGNEEFLQAKPAERKALAARFDLIDLTLLEADLSIMPGAEQTFTVTGQIKADITQECVVTLEPIHTHLDIAVDTTFMPADQESEEADSPAPGELEAEFEFYSGNKIDLGEMVSQYLGIAIDPYPRKLDAALPTTEFGTKAEKKHPFAHLAAVVKNKDKSDN